MMMSAEHQPQPRRRWQLLQLPKVMPIHEWSSCQRQRRDWDLSRKIRSLYKNYFSTQLIVSVMGGKEQNSPIYISRIIPGGVADRHGGLKRGDQLLSVNGVSVEGEHHEKAVELLKAAPASVKLVVRYTPKVGLGNEQEMIIYSSFLL